VPEHRPGFHRSLDRRLANDRAAGARGARTTRRRALAVAALAALLGVAVLLATTGGPLEPGPATAGEVVARLESSLSTLRSASGVLVASGPAQGEPRRWAFTVTSRGDLRLEGPGTGEVVTYDAAAAVVRSAQKSASLGGGPLFYAERRGVGPASPDGGPSAWVLPVELSAYVRALVAAADPRVGEVVLDGRDAWRLVVETTPNPVAPELSGDVLEVVVDRTTGFPLRVVERKQGRLLRELRIEGLSVDVRLPPSAFRLAFPPGVEVMRSDDGFRRVALGEATAAAGTAPLVPSWVPPGYELAQVAVAPEPGPAGASGPVVVLSYRRGLELLLVTTRPGAGAGARLRDPLDTSRAARETERVSLSTGPFGGTEAGVVVAPGTVPHLWADAGGLGVTVAGDASRAELVRVVESLERLR
jgi:hypothetical protein